MRLTGFRDPGAAGRSFAGAVTIDRHSSEGWTQEHRFGHEAPNTMFLGRGLRRDDGSSPSLRHDPSLAAGMGLTALDIVVILLVGAGALFGWLRGFVCEVLSLLAWFLAIVALRYLHAPVHRAARPSRSAPARRWSPSCSSSASSSSAASCLAPARRAGAAVGGRAGRPRARRRLRRAEGADRRDPALPRRQPRLRYDLGPRRGPARMDGAIAHLSPAQRRAAPPSSIWSRPSAARRRPKTGTRRNLERRNDRDPAARHDGAGEARLRARRSRSG